MKNTKCIFALLIALILLCTSACADNGTDNSSADTGAEQSSSVEASAEQSAEPVPAGFDDGVVCGYHTLGNSMYGDVMFEYEGEHELVGITKKISLFLEYFDTDSFIYKAYSKLGEGAQYLEDEAKSEKDVPLADFENVYSAKYQFEKKKGTPENLKPQVYTYDEVREKDAPIFMLLEIVPLTESTIQDIQAQYGVNEEKAVSIYRRMVIDKLAQCGLYAEGFADLYTYDTTRACYIALTDRWADNNVEDYKYEDSVYKTCTHLFFSVYGKCADIEALESAVKSEDNKLFKVRAMAASDWAYDTGKSAYIVEDTEAFSHNYYHRGEDYLSALAINGLNVYTKF